MKKFLALLMCLALTASLFAGCKKNTQTSQTTIRYLNFKPEIAEVYQKIADKYMEEKGVKVIVETAAEGTYESTLKAKMSTSDAPTIFQINGPKGYAAWKDYCADLSQTKLYEHLTDRSLAIKSDNKVYGIPYVVEGYGLIYNKAIMDKYFAMDGRKTDIKSMDDIKSYDTFKAVVDDMTANKDKLGIQGVFASTSLKAGDDWRWQTHLANIPIYYEFKNNEIDLSSDKTDTITFEYGDNFKNIFDLYLGNSVTEQKMLGTKTVTDSMSEFALGECAMVQNGNWAWSQISEVKGNVVKSEDIKFMPIYTGVEGEKDQGICIGTENFLSINAKATDEEKKAAEEFLYWLYSSESGKNFVTKDLGFIAPFDTFKETEKPEDPLAKEVLRWMEKDDINNIPWIFTVFPSQTFKDDFGADLLQYAQGTKTWDTVKKDVVSLWDSEAKLSKK